MEQRSDGLRCHMPVQGRESGERRPWSENAHRTVHPRSRKTTVVGKRTHRTAHPPSRNATVVGKRTRQDARRCGLGTDLVQARRAKSGPVSPSFSSSFANSGDGLANGLPGSIGTEAQRACSPA